MSKFRVRVRIRIYLLASYTEAMAHTKIITLVVSYPTNKQNLHLCPLADQLSRTRSPQEHAGDIPRNTPPYLSNSLSTSDLQVWNHEPTTRLRYELSKCFSWRLSPGRNRLRRRISCVLMAFSITGRLSLPGYEMARATENIFLESAS